MQCLVALCIVQSRVAERSSLGSPWRCAVWLRRATSKHALCAMTRTPVEQIGRAMVLARWCRWALDCAGSACRQRSRDEREELAHLRLCIDALSLQPLGRDAVLLECFCVDAFATW